MPGRHSLFWKLAVVLVGFGIAIIWLSYAWSERVQLHSYRLSAEAQRVLQGYAGEAERAWAAGGAAGVDQWLVGMRQREQSWMAVVGQDLQSLGSVMLSGEEQARLTFMRRINWPMSKRAVGLPHVSLPFPHAPERGQLVMQLPQRYLPSGFTLFAKLFIHGVVPSALALVLCVVLYRVLISPLVHLREQANALRGDRLATRVEPRVSARRDELGELGQAFDHMAERLQHSVAFQRQLLRDLSHELRTPLSRLRVAAECELDVTTLRQRLEREVQCMQQLVDDTLELVWLDTERPRMPSEDIEVRALWELLCENACFESGWPAQQLVCELPADCRVRGHLNGLAQALENILRNAIRHSPAEGLIRLGGWRVDGDWLLHVEDQGGGVPSSALQSIFRPFTRLNAARPGGDGFGLGLAIAHGSVRMQGGELWAENGSAGLRLCLRLPSV